MLSYQDIAMTPVLSSKLPVSHNVYVHRTEQSSFRTKGVYPGLCTAPRGQGVELGSCAMALAHPAPAGRAAEPPKSPRGPEDSSWRSLWPRPFCGASTDCARGVLFIWTESALWCKPEKLLNSLRLSFPNRKGNSRFLGICTPGEKTPNQMLQTPRNPFKDGKFFYTLFQNLSSIKS